jgi:predicted transcriptional regulator
VGRKINWKASVGYSIPFKYNNIEDYINIVKYDKSSNSTWVYITINKFVDEPHKVTIKTLKECCLEHLVGNRIITCNPELIKYLHNQDDGYKYSVGSHKQIDVCCPICGFSRQMRADHLFQCGFSCSCCGDGVGYPNKFIFNMLSQLHINFISEVSKKNSGFEWAKKYRYDFYFEIDGQKFLIEADGGFHKYQSQQINDKIKTNLAYNNGYHLIRINCNYNNNNRFDFIKNNILNSKLSTLLNLSDIDWDECNKFATNNLTEHVCFLWENLNKSVGEISSICQLNRTTVCKYLQNGFLIGLCPSYNKEVSKVRSRYKHIAYIENNRIVYVFYNAKEVSDMSPQMFGQTIARSSIQAVCIGRKRSVYGMKFKYITKEEYEQYKMIKNNNEVVLQEVA